MCTTYNDEELITKSDELHEGVLYWKTLDEIKNLMVRARSGNDKEAEIEYENCNAEEARLELTIQHNYEAANGKLEDTE
eukprot:6456752-Amphidinium_carterae.1